jgi:hypothetical protein
VPYANAPGLRMPGCIRRRGWRLLVLIMAVGAAFLVQCLMAEVAAMPSPEPTELCACTCAPVSILSHAPVALPLQAFNLSLPLPPWRWVHERENVVTPRVVRPVWCTRGPPSLGFSPSECL